MTTQIPTSATPSKTSYTYYHAGPLFTLSDLHTNTLLSSLIHSLSASSPTTPTFKPLVPQNIEARDTTPHSIRDQDIRALLSCDLALFTFDGSELDSGTVVEFCIAKFADIPAVILRTDFRGGGDQDQGGDGDGNGKGDPWNLMCSFWPRTVNVVVDSMGGYKAGLARSQGEQNVNAEVEGVENVVALDSVGGPAMGAGQMLLRGVADKCIEGMSRVVEMPGVMPREVRESVWRWIGVMPGFKGGGVGGEDEVKAMLEVLRGKEEKGLC